ncbi:MAG: GDSL-type esterase/lipase family protein [Candidatus Omnitrophica bacterium]|nr:GDSL-type esterase/lipase family protein [Candidatus Omnitrophota bacterium]
MRVYLNYHTLYDEEMSRYSLVLKRDSNNPLIGHEHIPNKTMKLMNVMVRINSDGFRCKEYSVSKSNKTRIILLGDSITFGWGVEEEETFASILERKLNKIRPTEVINFGTGNYNTEQEVNLFIEKGLKYKPDKVVVFYFINDVEPAPKKSAAWFLAHSRLITFYWSRMHILAEKFCRSKRYEEYYANLYKDDQPGLVRAECAFLRLRGICNKNNIRLQVVMIPELHDPKNYPFKTEYGVISAFLGKSNIESLDLTQYFRTFNDPMELWVARDDAHPNKKAHMLIAEHTIDFIK